MEAPDPSADADGTSNQTGNRDWMARLHRGSEGSQVGKPGKVGFKGPSPQQAKLLRSLLQSRGISQAIQTTICTKLDENELSAYEAGKYIVYLKKRRHFSLER